ncbi:hypothetical protein I6N96_01035 [Enterococcus sp. BWM-S5]|uniref:DUF3168 domain-containing protein n=1 Tax=Enterococcus larvae TaxID=2794352 RepID=A0ABS4CFD5_9ENTE|nr:hypothetical protein [Enterococcus larvae]MBP1044846.1 hypothetical protein [Enterococcus larvae]
MIIELTADIVNGVLSIPEVVEWVARVQGVPNISANKLPALAYPAIAIYELENIPGMFADDQEETSVVTFQISLFSKDGSHGNIQNFIDGKMKHLGFLRVVSSPLIFDKTENTIQRALIYSQEIEQEIYKKEGK